MIWTPKSGIEYIYRERERVYSNSLLFFTIGGFYFGGFYPNNETLHLWFSNPSATCLSLLLLFANFLWCVRLSLSWRPSKFAERLGFKTFNVEDVVFSRTTMWWCECDWKVFFCKCVLCTRWFKPWPFHPQTLEVTKHHWKGSRKLTIPKRALCIESPGNFCLLVGH